MHKLRALHGDGGLNKFVKLPTEGRAYKIWEKSKYGYKAAIFEFLLRKFPGNAWLVSFELSQQRVINLVCLAVKLG